MLANDTALGRDQVNETSKTTGLDSKEDFKN